jgi:hypothetical protein
MHFNFCQKIPLSLNTSSESYCLLWCVLQFLFTNQIWNGKYSLRTQGSIFRLPLTWRQCAPPIQCRTTDDGILHITVLSIPKYNLNKTGAQLGGLTLFNHNPSIYKIISFCPSKYWVQRHWYTDKCLGCTIRGQISGKRFLSSPKRPDRLLKPPSLLFKRYWRFLPQGQSGRGLKLITHLHLRRD